MDFKKQLSRFLRKEFVTNDEFVKRIGCSNHEKENHPEQLQKATALAFGFKISDDISLTDQEVKELLPWVRKFPIKALEQRGQIQFADDRELVEGIFRFMKIGRKAGLEKYYACTKQTIAPAIYAAWIRLGEISVKRLTDEFVFDEVIIDRNLKFLRRNSFFSGQNLRSAVKEAIENCDIKFVEVEPFITAPFPVCASYWVGNQPVVQLTTTKLNDALLLNAVARAVGHLLYHSKRSVYLQWGEQKSSELGPKATQFAENILLTEAEECELICGGHFEERRCIQHYAKVFKVRPSLLIRRLQEQGKLSWKSRLNEFKAAV